MTLRFLTEGWYVTEASHRTKAIPEKRPKIKIKPAPSSNLKTSSKIMYQRLFRKFFMNFEMILNVQSMENEVLKKSSVRR